MIKNFGIHEELDQFNKYVNETLVEINKKVYGLINLDSSFTDDNYRQEVTDFILRHCLIKYIHEKNTSPFFFKWATNFYETFAKDPSLAYCHWYETYYRYLLVYSEELLLSIANKSYYWIIAHLRQILELDLFLHTYHGFSSEEKTFYTLITLDLYFKKGWDFLSDLRAVFEKLIAHKLAQEIKSDNLKELLLDIQSCWKPIYSERLIFSIQKKNTKVNKYTITSQLVQYREKYYKTIWINKLYEYFSESIHPNNISFSFGDKSLLTDDKIEISTTMTHRTNSFIIPIILWKFQAEEIYVDWEPKIKV